MDAMYFQLASYIVPESQTVAISKSVEFIFNDKYKERAPNAEPMAIPVSNRRLMSRVPFFQEKRKINRAAKSPPTKPNSGKLIMEIQSEPLF
ncbi:Uncharacterised protein [Chlamydia trachomatis]|nr:Uncharacterised protein [Chlamydia trachomatis]